MSPERVIALRFPAWPAPKQEDAGDFAPVFARLTELVPEIEAIRPGLVVMRARGPARYYGGERQAAEALLGFAVGEGHAHARVGVADGRFAAEQASTEQTGAGQAHAVQVNPDPASPPAARAGGDGRQAAGSGESSITIVPPGGSAAFLSELPIAAAADERLAALLPGLGIYTLGAFASLPEDAVRARFGQQGVRLHRHALGEDADRDERIRPQLPKRDLSAYIEFEPPVDGAEHLAFACSTLAEGLGAALTEEGLVCTTLRVTITDDIGVRHERDWAHPRFFSPADTLARIRWQAAGLGGGSSAGESTGAGITAVRLSPVRTDRAAAHEPGLWNTGADERVHHHLSRAQGLLGPSGVGTLSLEGGRLLHERQRFTPWGSAPRRERPPGPWPGALGEPQPSLVFAPPLRARLLGADGAAVGIDDDDLFDGAPHELRVEGALARGEVRGWSRPWPIRERWWEGRPERFRVQLELDDGDAWLLLGRLRSGAGHGPTASWFAEGRYD